MAALLISCLLNLFLFYSFGVLFQKSLSESFTEKLIVGFAIAGSLLSLLSLFFPVNSKVLIGMTLLGASIIIFNWSREMILLKNTKPKSYIILFSLFLIVAFATAISPQQVYDSGLYYLQNIKWISQYPAVPGLANLHGRFGFNPASFLWNSLTSMNFLYYKPVFSLNFTLLGILIAYFINKILTLYKDRGLSEILLFNLIIFCFILGLNNLISSPTPDFIATGLSFYIFSRFTDLWRENSGSMEKFLPLFIISLYLITVKLSTLPVLLLFPFLLIKKRQLNLPFIKKLIIIGIFILTPWLLGNIILTGWLIYPFPSLDLFNFDWKVPIEYVIREKQAVTGWARVPGERYIWAANIRINEWFPIWWNQLDYVKKSLFIFCLLFPVSSLAYSILKRKITNVNPIIFTSLLGVVFWFSMAPDFRFGKAFIITSALAPLLIFKFSYKPENLKKNPIYTILILCLVFYFKSTYNNFRSVYGILSGSLEIQEIQMPAELKFSRALIEGQPIYSPREGDRCYDHPLPCTTSNKTINRIEMRGNTLRNGFKPKM